jgi:hypothetical protein
VEQAGFYTHMHVSALTLCNNAMGVKEQGEGLDFPHAALF